MPVATRPSFVLAVATILAFSTASFAQLSPQPSSIAALEQQALKDDGEVSAHLALARLYRQAGQGAQAVTLMQQAEIRQPDNEDVLAQLGYALIDAGQFKEAVEVFDKLTAINHKSVAGHNGKAVAFDKAGNHVAAQDIYQTALKLAPNSAIVINNLALSYIMHHQPDMAISLLEPWMKQSSAPASMRYNLALAYGVKGDAARAHALNIQTMSEKEARENQVFYEEYARMLKQEQLDALSPKMQARVDEEDNTVKPVELKPAAGQAKTIQPIIQPNTAPATSAEPIFEEPKTKFWGFDAEQTYPGSSRQ
ncbi:MAG: tetratricopeptide repeat protein [Rickettsiales bacterium]|jgi:Flp pilus assembly protein TadD|nr:tetratricopeptide repeat protein [Rickettsiales bacterium]